MTKLDEFLKFEVSTGTMSDDFDWISKAKQIIRKQAQALQEIAEAKEYKFEVIDDDDGQTIRVTGNRAFIVPSSHAEQCQKEIESLLDK